MIRHTSSLNINAASENIIIMIHMMSQEVKRIIY